MRELAKRPIVGATDNQALGHGTSNARDWIGATGQERIAHGDHVITEGANTAQISDDLANNRAVWQWARAHADENGRLTPVEEPAEWLPTNGPLYTNDYIATIATRAERNQPSREGIILYMRGIMELMRDDYEQKIEQIRERWKGVVARERSKRQAQPTTTTRQPREIEERIARLAILWHTAPNESTGLRYLDQARSLIWAMSPDVPWGESEEAAVATLKAIIEEEGLE